MVFILQTGVVPCDLPGLVAVEVLDALVGLEVELEEGRNKNSYFSVLLL